MAEWNVYSLPRSKAQCPVCGKWLRLLKQGRLWPHGPANRLCDGSWASRAILSDELQIDGGDNRG